MVNPAGMVAHLIRLAVTVACIKNLGDSYRAKELTWSQHAFQIFFTHSALGVIRFGASFAMSTTTVAKFFRNLYDLLSVITDVVPLALLTTDILNGYKIDEKIRLILLSLGFLPIFFQLAGRPKGSQIRKFYLMMNITATLQLLAVLIVGLQNVNYGVISLVVSYAFQRFFVEEFCCRYDVPYIALTQYSFCFVEIFAILTLKEL